MNAILPHIKVDGRVALFKIGGGFLFEVRWTIVIAAKTI